MILMGGMNYAQYLMDNEDAFSSCCQFTEAVCSLSYKCIGEKCHFEETVSDHSLMHRFLSTQSGSTVVLGYFLVNVK